MLELQRCHGDTFKQRIFFMMFASKKSTQHCTGNRTDAVWNRIVCSAAYLKQRRSIVLETEGTKKAHGQM